MSHARAGGHNSVHRFCVGRNCSDRKESRPQSGNHAELSDDLVWMKTCNIGFSVNHEQDADAGRKSSKGGSRNYGDDVAN